MEVVLPQIACQHGWDTCHEKDIKLRICQSLGVQVPRYPSRTVTSTTDLKRIIVRCYEIIQDPSSFFTLTNENKH